MASGTGLTTGPYTPVAGVELAIGDPTAQYGNTATSVQVQNNSGFTLSVLTDGDSYTVPPLTATTLPVVNGQGIVVTPVQSTGYLSSNSYTLVWLQTGMDAPSPDGYLSAVTSGLVTLTPLTFQFIHDANGVKVPVAIPAGSTAFMAIFHFESSSPVDSNMNTWSISIDGPIGGNYYLVNNGSIPNGNQAPNTTVALLLDAFGTPGTDTEVTITFKGDGVGGHGIDCYYEVFGSASGAFPVTRVAPTGGQIPAKVTLTSTGAQTLLATLGAESGWYRLHRVTLDEGGASGQYVKIIATDSDGVTWRVATLEPTVPPLADNLEGLVTTFGITAQLTAHTVDVVVTLWYDVTALGVIT